ncbi:MAG TPA: hypothetical protein VM784_08805, partial [Actinomycetota bacterium]|nr:hypothetical protein [Actinomycetota bacterium]
MLATPRAWDSAQEGAGVDSSPHASMGVERRESGFVIDVRLDGSWLQAPARKFPVFLDPTVTITGANPEASFEVTCGECTGTTEELRVGSTTTAT